MTGTTTTSMPTTAEFQAAIDTKTNIIVSTEPGIGTVSRTLAELNGTSDKVLIVDALGLDLMATWYLDTTAEIIVVDEVHLSSPMVREQIAELMRDRTINGQALPKLKSVVVFFTHSNPETDQYAAQLAALAPALSINLSYTPA